MPSSTDFAPGLTFGDWLRRRRGALGLTQTDLAQQLNCAVVTLRKFESEERRPSPEMAQSMTTVLQLPPEQHAAFVRFARGEIRAGEELEVDKVFKVDRVDDVTNLNNLTNLKDLKPALPIPPYAIIGRERLIEQASAEITQAQARVLTLVGAPGVGKTRLALELAHRLHVGFADGALFVELAPVRDVALVPAAIAEALRINDNTSADTPAAVFAALRNQHLLLVLDNFEQVLDAASFVAELVSRCAKLTCLVTSRERLRIRAEHALQVNVLAVPDAATVTLEVLQAAPASRLFITRATEANANLNLTEDDAPAIAELCAQLEGLPLALELLAARADLFSPAELLVHLQSGLGALDALEFGPRDLPERHRGLRAAIEWSLRLLNDAQRKQFAHMAVFAGGFDESAARAIFDNKITNLMALAQTNLIQVQAGGRCHLLEPIRQYTEEMLAKTDDAEQVRQRHAQYFAALACDARDALLGPDAEAWTKRLEVEHANILAALQWALHNNHAEMALGIGQGIFRFWHRRGWWREALGWLEAALQMDGAARAPLDLRAKATRAAGYMAHTLGQYDRAEKHFSVSLSLSYELEDDEQVAAAYVGLGNLRREQGRFDESLSYFDRAIPLEPEPALKFPWQNKADLLLRLGRLDDAAALYEQAMALNKRIGDEEGMAHTLRGLGEVAWRRGDTITAEHYFRENDVIARKLHHAIGLALTQKHFGNIACVRGHWAEAAEHYAEALTQMSQMGDRRGVCEVLAACVHLAVVTGRFELAAQWLSMAEVGFRPLNAKLTPHELSLMETYLAQCTTQLAPDVLAQALARGAQIWDEGDVEQVVAQVIDDLLSDSFIVPVAD
jgi:predicted ATPase/DNA-binding XRE family transcriptional regulator